tara:strand:+ start:18484 stop:18930 length:447 start_codon:yes stop_codon:yes gene_type:complete
MKNKIPPPIVTLFFSFCIVYSNHHWPQFEIQFLKILGLVFFVLGICVIFVAVRLFKNQETTVNPISIKKASSLVVNGIFQYSRNPMYLGMTFILLGISFYSNPVGGILLTILFIMYITQFQIKPEEKAMKELFADQWIEYKEKVRRWI